MILGLRAAIYPVAHLDAARRRYSEMLGLEPRFGFYVRDPFCTRFGLIQNPQFDPKAVR